MGTDRLYQVLPFMRELKKDRREAIEQFFKNAPDWLLESFRVVELDKNVVFIRENQPVDTVHIIARGMFKITDYRVYGIAYDFMQFDGINAMGGMELIMDMDTYQATLQTYRKHHILHRVSLVKMHSSLHCHNRHTFYITK